MRPGSEAGIRTRARFELAWGLGRGWAGSVAAPPHTAQCFLRQAAGQEQYQWHQAASALSPNSSAPRQVGVDEAWPPETLLPLPGIPGTQ